MQRVLAQAAPERQADLEAWETAIRAGVLAAGAKALDALMEGIRLGRQAKPAGCSSLIGLRLEQPGMEWSVRGANAIIALRWILHSGRLQGYSESRVG